MWNAWGKPYFASRSLKNRKELRPIIAYLFTEWKCNLSCHYCWAFDNRVKGMSEDVARRSIDWLHSNGNRVLALMGGEPLLRPQFIHKITDYAAKKGFFVYVPTNGRLMRPDVVDRSGRCRRFDLQYRHRCHQGQSRAAQGFRAHQGDTSNIASRRSTNTATRLPSIPTSAATIWMT